MSQFLIEVDENAIKEQIAGILNTVLKQELRSRYSDTGREISAAVKELIYANKDRIIDGCGSGKRGDRPERASKADGQDDRRRGVMDINRRLS